MSNMEVPRLNGLQSALFMSTMCAAICSSQSPPTLPSYNFGVKGDPSQIETAFGNLGQPGPSSDVTSRKPTETSSEEITEPTSSSLENTEKNEQPAVAVDTEQSLISSSTPTVTDASNKGTTAIPIAPPAAVPTEVLTTALSNASQPLTTTSRSPPNTPSQTFETGTPTTTGRPTSPATPKPTKPGQQNGTEPPPSSSIVIQPVFITYYLAALVLVISMLT